MEKTESLDEFYKRKFNWIPENLKRDIGHFNVFRLEPFAGDKAQPLPYKRRDFYKIMLVRGNSRVHYADKVIDVKKQALSFSNPLIPYKWEHLDDIRKGYFCIFNKQFFSHFGNINDYSVFRPDGSHILELTDEEAAKVEPVYIRMLEEINSDYIHKYDLLRTLVFELLHFAMKLQPASITSGQHVNASQRISALFIELLERQFPIDDLHQAISLRTPSHFAAHLNIHVNHLNRALKETFQKTTTEIIAERIIHESKILLRHSKWNVSEISQSLGFEEITHFDNFFRKHTDMNPSRFRKS